MAKSSDRSPSVTPVSPLVASERFLKSAKWSSQAGADLQMAVKARDAAMFCRAWWPRIPPQLESAAKPPEGMCLWSMVDHGPDDEIARLARHGFSSLGSPAGRRSKSAIRVQRTPSDHLTALVHHLTAKWEPWSPIETITVGELLISGGQHLDTVDVWNLWCRLASECLRTAPAPAGESPDQLLTRAGERPFLAGLLLAPLQAAQKLCDQGRQVLVHELFARTDRDGSPHADLLSRLPLWLAPLIRATLWAERFHVTLWSDEQRDRLSLVLERAIPLCRPNGRLALSNGHAVPVLPLLDVASRRFPLTRTAEKLLRGLIANPKPSELKKNRTVSEVQVMPSAQSDWARFAVLRSDWSSHADSLAIAHHQPIPQLDVAALGQSLLHGGWGLDLQIGDAVIQPAPEWSCSCWASDPDADYLELQMEGPGDLRVERQVLLSRQEHFLLLADSIRGAKSVAGLPGKTTAEPRIHLRSRLPFADGVIADPDPLTRAIRLKAGRLTIRVLPLALPDDRVQSTPHEFVTNGQDLVLHQIGVGNGLFAPLLLDWHPARSRQPALWRTLTVTEAGQVVGRDVAAGHRVQIGKFQLLIYRGLAPATSARAVLGHHTWHESIIARVDSNGDVETVMNVES